jgi:arylsulfatase A-like enzyme
MEEAMVDTVHDRCAAPPISHVSPPRRGSASLLLNAIAFGLFTGWLELALVLARRMISARISMDMLRMNRHYLWMIPLSNLLIFIAVGLLLLIVSWTRPGLARRLAWRLPFALSAFGLLLTIEGLHVIASALLALGIAVLFGPLLERRAERLARLPRTTLPLLAVGLAAWAGVGYARVSWSESSALAALPAAAKGAQNLVFIVLDDVRAASMSLYGHGRPTTPNLERLARSGVLFSHARPTASWTLPSHASMFTGQWPHRLSVGLDLPLDATFPTLAEHLARQGYAAAGFVGNTYYCNALYGLGRGFARFEDNYENQSVSLFEIIRASGVGKCVLQALGHSVRVAEGQTAQRKTAAMLNRDALRWIGDRPQDRPFFVFLNYYDAHGPFVPPDDSAPRFGLGALPQRDQVEILKRFHRLKRFASTPADGPPATVEREGIAVLRDSYESCIAYLDRQIGLLFDELERRKLMNDTVVIVTSDHGEHFQEHGVFGHGLTLYRQEVHVPLLIFSPAHRSTGRVVAEPVSLRDLPATSVDLLGLADRSPFPGRSLSPLWRDGAELTSLPAPSPPLSEIEHHVHLSPMPHVPASLGPVKSLVDQGLVFIRNGNGREEVYDLIRDPLETRDLVGDAALRPAVVRFRRMLEQVLEGPLEDPPLVAKRGDGVVDGSSLRR